MSQKFIPLNESRVTNYAVVRPQKDYTVKPEALPARENTDTTPSETPDKTNKYNMALTALGTVAMVCAGIGLYKCGNIRGALTKVNKKMGETSEHLTSRTDSLDAAIRSTNENLANSISSLAEKMSTAHENLTHKVNSLDETVTQVNEHLSGRVDTLNETLTNKIDTLETEIKHLEAQKFTNRCKRFFKKLAFWKKS